MLRILKTAFIRNLNKSNFQNLEFTSKIQFEQRVNLSRERNSPEFECKYCFLRVEKIEHTLFFDGTQKRAFSNVRKIRSKSGSLYSCHVLFWFFFFHILINSYPISSFSTPLQFNNRRRPNQYINRTLQPFPFPNKFRPRVKRANRISTSYTYCRNYGSILTAVWFKLLYIIQVYP